MRALLYHKISSSSNNDRIVTGYPFFWIRQNAAKIRVQGDWSHLSKRRQWHLPIILKKGECGVGGRHREGRTAWTNTRTIIEQN